MDRGAWQAIVSGVADLDLTEQQIRPCTTGGSSIFFFPFKGRSIPKFLKGAVIFPSYEDYGFPGGSAVRNPPANAGDLGSIPGPGRSPGEGNGTHSSIIDWEIPWTEEPDRLQSTGPQESDTSERLNHIMKIIAILGQAALNY